MTKSESVSRVSVGVAGAGERQSLPILLSHTPETQSQQGLQHDPAQEDRARSHSPAMAKEDGEANNIYPDGEGLVYVPRGLLDHKADCPAVFAMGHPALICSKAPGGSRRLQECG